MTSEDIKSAVRDVLKEQQDEFWISQPQHYMDHHMLLTCRERQDEWRKNHEFIASVRTGAALGRKVGITVIFGSTISFFLGAIWLAIKNSLMK